MVLSTPINIVEWYDHNYCYTGRTFAQQLNRTKKYSSLLKPPVNNHCIYDGDMVVMVSLGRHDFTAMVTQIIPDLQILGGPNARTDYHVNETPEWFYQYQGGMLLKVIDPEDGNKFKDIRIEEGEMFLLPPNTPHNPVRFANTAGLVIEQKRPVASRDRMRWYCQNCHQLVHEASFHCTDLGSQIKDAVFEFENNAEARRCKHCGTTCSMKPEQHQCN